MPEDLRNKLEEFNNSGNYFLPYFYDYLKDLASACIEFLDTTLDSPQFLWPKKDNFSDYISLGLAIKPIFGDAYRMGLYRLPFTCADKELIYKPKKLMERMQLLADINSSFENEQQLTGHAPSVTPSSGMNFPLSERAIPFYLAGKDKLAEVWNYSSAQRKLLSSIPGVDDKQNKKLLLRDMDAYDFFRIQGHAGRLLVDTKKEIELLRSNLHLPFDIKVLFLGDEKLEDQWLDEYKTSFSDLKLMLENALANLACDQFCGRNLIKLLFSDWTGREGTIERFEAIGNFFAMHKFPIEEEEWIRRAQGACKDICDDRE